MVESKGSSRTMVVIGTLVMALAAGAIILFALFNRPAQSTITNNDGPAVIEGEPFTGIEAVEPPRKLQDFTLTGHTGEPVSLSDFSGKMVLMLFGYTNCPDVCPVTLLEFKQVRTALGDQAEDVAFVFISVDGERDTPEVMADYIARFDPAIVGMTGDEATLTRIGTDYDLYFAKRADASGSTENYLVDHNSNTYLINAQGELVALYVYGTEAALIAQDIAGRLEA